MCSERRRALRAALTSLVSVFFLVAACANGASGPEAPPAPGVPTSSGETTTEASRGVFWEAEVEDSRSAAGFEALATRLNALREDVAGAEDAKVEVDVAEIEATMASLPVSGTTVAARLHFVVSLDRWAERLASEGASDALRRRARQQGLDQLDRTLEARAQIAPVDRSSALGYRARFLERAGRTDEALAANDGAILQALAAGRPALIARWNAQRGGLLRALGEGPAALAALREARAAFGRVGTEVSPDERLALAREVLFPLADLLLTTPNGAAGGASQARLREVQLALEELRIAEITEFFGDECLAGRTQRRLETIPGAVVLYPVVFPDRIELIVGKYERLHRFTVETSGIDPARALAAFRASLQDPTSFRYRRHGARFYDWLVRPLETLLEDEADVLVFVPTAEWMGLPVAALWNQEKRRFLVDEIAVAVTPGLELTEPSPVPVEGARVLAAGLTTEVEGFARLETVAEELDRVLEVMPGHRLEGPAFTTDTLADMLAEERFEVVHIASHGFFDDRASESFLVTAEGRLTLVELGRLVRPVGFRSRGRLELLVLSACETGAGSPRAAFGLAGVAVQAGAQSALASLWRVNDEAATQLVTAFYRALFLEGRSRAESLRSAQQRLREDPRFAHPFYWSPFILLNAWL